MQKPVNLVHEQFRLAFSPLFLAFTAIDLHRTLARFVDTRPQLFKRWITLSTGLDSGNWFRYHLTTG